VPSLGAPAQGDRLHGVAAGGQQHALTEFVGDLKHFVHAVGAEGAASDTQGHEHIPARRRIHHQGLLQIRPAGFAGFFVFVEKDKRHRPCTDAAQLEAAGKPAEVAQHQTDLVECGGVLQRFALIQNDMQAPLIARAAIGVDPVGAAGFDLRRRRAGHPLPLATGAQGVDGLPLVSLRDGEEVGKTRAVGRSDRKPRQGEGVRGPTRRPEARRAADHQTAVAAAIEPYQIGGIAVDREQVGQEGFRARLGKPGEPAVDVLQAFGRIADELRAVGIGPVAPDAGDGNPREHARDLLVGRLQLDVDGVPARTQLDGLLKLGGATGAREQQQRQQA
jgi:hypothetical protein